jgi:hypothetical protein
MTPKALVNAIEKLLGVIGQPKQLRDVIEQILLSLGSDPARAAEESEAAWKHASKEIRRRMDVAEANGEVCIVHVRGDRGEVVFGSSFIFGDDAEQIRSAKENRVFVSGILNAIRSIEYSQFEVFGRCVLKELGCSPAKITPHAGDQGIDFYGQLSLGNLLGADTAILKLMHETKVILVGQAKHYPNSSIGPGTVRELVGALSLARTYTFSKDGIDLLSEVQLRPFSPVLALLFSTGDFTSGARHLAKRAGLIIFSGHQLAVFLADRGVGIARDDGQPRFCEEAFTTWLSG